MASTPGDLPTSILVQCRPCINASCPHNNYLTVSRTGLIKLSHGDRLPEEVPPDESCSLDVADQGPQTLERVGEIMGLTRERVRQIEVKILAKLRAVIELHEGGKSAWHG